MSAYLDDECDAETETRVLEHLRTCLECRTYMNGLVSDEDLLKKMPVDPPGGDSYFATMTEQILERTKPSKEQAAPRMKTKSRFYMNPLAAALIGVAATVVFFMLFEVRLNPFWSRDKSLTMEEKMAPEFGTDEKTITYKEESTRHKPYPGNGAIPIEYRGLIENSELLLVRVINMEDPKEFKRLIDQLKKSQFLNKVDLLVASNKLSRPDVNDHFIKLRALLKELITGDLSNPGEKLKKIREEVIESGIIEQGRLMIEDTYPGSI
jgi:hypothetical protein